MANIETLLHHDAHPDTVLCKKKKKNTRMHRQWNVKVSVSPTHNKDVITFAYLVEALRKLTPETKEATSPLFALHFLISPLLSWSFCLHVLFSIQDNECIICKSRHISLLDENRSDLLPIAFCFFYPSGVAQRMLRRRSERAPRPWSRCLACTNRLSTPRQPPQTVLRTFSKSKTLPRPRPTAPLLRPLLLLHLLRSKGLEVTKATRLTGRRETAAPRRSTASCLSTTTPPCACAKPPFPSFLPSIVCLCISGVPRAFSLNSTLDSFLFFFSKYRFRSLFCKYFGIVNVLLYF